MQLEIWLKEHTSLQASRHISEATKIRQLRNENAHRHPDFVDSLELIEKWVSSEDEQQKTSEQSVLRVKRMLPQAY